MKKARNLPKHVLLDALAHLPAADIDCSWRFVNHAFCSMVKRLESVLPKHTIVLHEGSPPASDPLLHSTTAAQGRRHSQPGGNSNLWRPPYSPTIGWFSFEVGGQRRVIALDWNGLRTLLGSERLGRIARISIADRRDFGYSNRFLELLGQCFAQGVGLPRFACMELQHSDKYRFYSNLTPEEIFPTSHQIHHFPRGTFPISDFMLISGSRRGVREKGVHLIYCSTYCTTEVEIFLSILHRRFVNALGEFHFLHGGELLMHFVDAASNAEPADQTMPEMLGQPDEPLRRVGKWLEIPPESDHSLATFRGYYRRMEGCDWKVWRVLNPHLRSTRWGGGRGKYLRVMQKVGGGDANDWALHLKVFDGDGRNKERDID